MKKEFLQWRLLRYCLWRWISWLHPKRTVPTLMPFDSTNPNSIGERLSSPCTKICIHNLWGWCTCQFPVPLLSRHWEMLLKGQVITKEHRNHCSCIWWPCNWYFSHIHMHHMDMQHTLINYWTLIIIILLLVVFFLLILSIIFKVCALPPFAFQETPLVLSNNCWIKRSSCKLFMCKSTLFPEYIARELESYWVPGDC